MAIFGQIKTADPKFKGDKEKSWLVVSGKIMDFSRILRQDLSVLGLSRKPRDGTGSERWTTSPQIGQDLRAALHYLHDKHGVRINKDDVEKIKSATSSWFPASDPLASIGRPSSHNPEIGPGNRPLQIHGSVKESILIANCDKEDSNRASFLRGMGFLPVRSPSQAMIERFGSQPWSCGNPFAARPALPWLTRSGTEAMKSMTSRFVGNFRNGGIFKLPDGSEFTVPAPNGLDYLDFQKVSIDAIAKSGTPGGVITDDMGLGKTIQGLGVINAFPDVRSVLILCEANMKAKWALEAEKWLVNSDLTIGVAHGSVVPDTNVVVMNYDIVQKNRGTLDTIKWDIQILDEAHNLKNPESGRTKAVLGDVTGYGNREKPIPVSKNGGRVFLTGTPRPNSVLELWPILTSAFPKTFGRGLRAYEAFRDRYAPPFLIQKDGRNGKKQVIPLPSKKSIRNEELFLSLRGAGMIRRLKRDADIGLKGKYRTPLMLDVEISEEDLALMRRAEMDLAAIEARHGTVGVKDAERDVARPVIDIMAHLKDDTPDFTEMARVRRNLGLVKAPHAAASILDELQHWDEMFEQSEDRPKMVVFAHHKEVIDTLRAKIEEVFPDSVLVYDGRTKAKDRQPTVDRFQEDESKRVIILSGAGITGITLTRASVMRIVEPDWTPAKVVQLEDRIWRIGQEREVDIGYIFLNGTLDGRIGKALMRKMQSEEITMNSLKMDIRDPEKQKETPKAGETIEMAF